MTGFFDEGLAGVVATWIAALLTIGVWAYLVGERRFFRLAQHLLAGLASGYLTVLAVREVLLPRLIEPLSTDPGGQLLLWPALVLVLAMAGARWLPRPVVAVPVAILVGGVAAFALGGAVVGTMLPQMAGALLLPGTAGVLLNGLIGLVITAPGAGRVPAWRATRPADGGGRGHRPLAAAGRDRWLARIPAGQPPRRCSSTACSSCLATGWGSRDDSGRAADGERRQPDWCRDVAAGGRGIGLDQGSGGGAQPGPMAHCQPRGATGRLGRGRAACRAGGSPGAGRRPSGCGAHRRPAPRRAANRMSHPAAARPHRPGGRLVRALRRCRTTGGGVGRMERCRSRHRR